MCNEFMFMLDDEMTAIEPYATIVCKTEEDYNNIQNALEKQNNHCDSCRYLREFNKSPIFAYCEKNDWIFKLWETDTRNAYCGNYKHVEVEK